MAVEINQHVEKRGDDPLAAVITGRETKAYLVANLALNDGPQAAAEHYNLTLAQVYNALTFHYDNADTIREALATLRQVNDMTTISDHIATIRQRAAKD